MSPGNALGPPENKKHKVKRKKKVRWGQLGVLPGTERTDVDGHQKTGLGEKCKNRNWNGRGGN